MKKQENLLMKGKWLTGVLVLAMAAVTLAGCGAKDETKEKVEQVTLNEVATPFFTPRSTWQLRRGISRTRALI